MGAIRATVVVPTRDRPDDLRRCLSALARQTDEPRFEVVVVDDGSRCPVAGWVAEMDPRFRTLRREGEGPARARNAGAAGAAEILLFTDDDTEVAEGWIGAACHALDADRAALGVEGPVTTPSWDPLHAYSVFSREPGAYLTCNVGYRRDIFDAVGGFYEGFPFPACEDHDLAYRILDKGRVAWAPEMVITHHPRSLTFRQIARRGLYAESDVLLFLRHPERFGKRGVRTWSRSMKYGVDDWVRRARSSKTNARTPRRAARLVALAAVQSGYAALGSCRAFRTVPSRRAARRADGR